MVVLGNPPYSYASDNKSPFIRGLIDDYMRVDGAPLGERNPKGLQDDYVKFIRFGQWRIGQTGEGVLAYISNNGYLDNPTFRGMRQSLMGSFDDIYILNLHGNANKRERAPDGGPDENVFDIRQGVAIALFIKRCGTAPAKATIHYADLWGAREGKYAALSTQDIASVVWQQLAPSMPFYLFVPQDGDLRNEYNQGWDVSALTTLSSVGIATSRDALTIRFLAQDVLTTVHRFASLSVEQARQEFDLGQDTRDWQVALAQENINRQPVISNYVRPILYRPFDVRYTYYTGQTRGFISMPRYERIRHLLEPNLGLYIGRQGQAVGDEVWNVLFCGNLMEDYNLYRRGNNACFPLYLYPTATDIQRQASLFDASDEISGPSGPAGRRANLSPEFISELTSKLGMQWRPDGRGDLHATVGPEDVFHYAYAVFHSPTYRARYAELLRIDFPRLPLTSDVALFTDLVQFGAELVDLHLLRLPGAVPADAVGGNGGAAALGTLRTTFPVSGSNVVEKVRYDATAQRVSINTQQYFGVCVAMEQKVRLY